MAGRALSGFGRTCLAALSGACRHAARGATFRLSLTACAATPLGEEDALDMDVHGVCSIRACSIRSR
jgi:hypothetical protein